MGLSLETPPTDEPLTWALVQKQTRQDGLDDDQEFVETIIIPAVRERAEGSTRRQFITAAYRLFLDGFPGCAWASRLYWGFDVSQGWYLEIPRPPLRSVTSITYVDPAGVTQTWDPGQYLVDAPKGPKCARGRIAPAYGVSWPQTRRQMNAVMVEFLAGYGTSTDVPPLLLQGMLLDAGTLYENREDIQIEPRVTAAIELPSGCASIYRGFRSIPRHVSR